MMACLGGHTDTVNLLLDMEADLTLKNIFGRTALNLAKSNNRTSLVARLQEVILP